MEIPIPTLHLFEPLDDALVALLKTISVDEWERRTLAKQWTVKDIAAHLLDGNLRTLSMIRDRFNGDAPLAGQINSYQNLVDYLNRLNADWVKAFKRISSSLLVELLERTGKPYCECLKQLDPFAPALYAVDWAGEKESQNWFHIAREFTEKWHHQQQIREALNRPGIMTREFYYPVMDTFMRALPHTYRNETADDNSVVRVTVTGEVGGVWILLRQNGDWNLSNNDNANESAEIILDPVTAWQLFTKGLDPAQAAKKITIKGDKSLGQPLLGMVSVMA